MKNRIFYDRFQRAQNDRQKSRKRHENDSHTQCVQFIAHLIHVEKQLVYVIEDHAIHRRNVRWLSHIVKKIQFSSFLLKRFVSLDAARRDKRFTRHNAKSQSHSDFIKKLDHVKSSQFNQHHKSHVHDDSFSEKIKTLHDTFWFRSIVESHFHFDKNSLRHEVESFANRTQSMKAHWSEQNQKSDEARAHVTIFDHNSQNRFLREWDTKISAINRRNDRIVNDLQSTRQIVLKWIMQRSDQKHAQASSSMICVTRFERFDALHENQRSQAENHSEDKERQFSSENWKDRRNTHEFVTIRQVSEE